MPLDDAIAKVTSVSGGSDLDVGQNRDIWRPVLWGDAIISELREGEFQLVDSRGETRVSRQNFVPITVIKGGQVYRQGRKDGLSLPILTFIW